MLSGWTGIERIFSILHGCVALHRPQQAFVLDAIYRAPLTPVVREPPGRTFTLTSRWSCRDIPVLSQTPGGRPSLDVGLKHVKVRSPSPALS